jgi:hypothetical protein
LADDPPEDDGVSLPWDFVLFLYRQEMGESWANLASGAVPRWRIERDLEYMRLRGRAQAYHAKRDESRDKLALWKRQHGIA